MRLISDLRAKEEKLRTETTTERRVGYTLKQVSEKFLLSDENIIATTKTTC